MKRKQFKIVAHIEANFTIDTQMVKIALEEMLTSDSADDKNPARITLVTVTQEKLGEK